MKHNYPYNLWLQFLQGTRLGKHVMLIFGVLFFMLFSSWNVVGQSTVTPSYEWLKAVPFGTVTQAETSGLTIAIDTDSQGNVYRLTFGDGVLKYDAEGIFIKKIIQANQLNDPLDIALDSNDNIYVIDYEDQAPFTDNGKIKIFNPLGVQIDRILTTYFRPLGIALDNEDNIYVVIYNDGSGAESNVSSELRVYNSNRTLIKKFGGTSAHPLLQPYRIGVDSQKNIYISHTANNGEVVVFDSSYNYLTTLSGMGSPGSVVVDEFDFIHVIDYSDRINFNQLLNYQTISQGELFFLYIGINTGISMKEFGIRIYDSNRVLQNPFFKDHLELPVDIAFGSCDRMFVNNSKTNGLSLEFELEIYKRTPSFDGEKPEIISCVPDQNATLTNGEFILPDYTGLAVFNAIDNCDKDLTITQNPPKDTSITGTRTVTITATDDAGNFASCDFEVIIEDEVVAPTFTCPSADTAPDLSLDTNCNFSAPSYSNLITNLTNFENDPFFDQSEVRSGNLLSVNIKIYDGDGGDFIGECNLNVNLIDNIDPQFTLCNIQNITVELEEGETYPVPNFVSQLTATDNCDSNPVITQSINEGTPITETTTIIITATDAANNTSNNCEVSIIITERQNPTFTCPSADAAPDLNLDSNCNFSAPSYSNLITNLTNFENDPFFDQSEVRSGNLLSVNIKIYDGDGGDFIGECNLNVNLVDNIDPQFTSCNIQDINVELENGETFAVPDFVSQLNATDNCDSNPVITQSIAYGTSITETTLITLIATDESGNVSNTCEVSINIAEKQDPTFDCLDPNQTTVLELDENCTYSVPNYSGRVTNFQNFTNEPFFVQTQVRNEDVLAVTINVFDGVNGEEAGSCQFLVNLEDQIPPVLTCPNDILIPYTDSKEYEIEDYYSQLIITDNCSDSFTYIQTPQPGSIVSEDTRIEFTIIDENNNQSSCNFEVKFYKESELQILNCPGDQIFEVDSNCSYLIPDIASSITTNIEGAVVTQNITPGFRVNGSLQLIITAKFEDQTDTCFVDLMAKDSTAPVVGCLEDQNETFDSENGFIIPNYSLQAQTSDNCFIAKIDQIPDVGTEVFEDTQVTIGVEDISGNYTTCTFTVFLTEETTGNNVPVALNDTYSIDQDAILSIGSPGVLGNDTDADNDLLTAIIQTQATNGTVSLNTDGSFTYTPDNGYFGPDTFTYVANDGTVNSNVATVTIAVKDTSLPNSIPVALDDTFEVDQNSILSIPIPGILGNDSDADNDNLIAIIESEPTSGELILNNDGSFTYTPNSGFTGEVTFTYVANDGSENSNVATVTITVTATTNTNVICKDSVTLELDENGVVTLDAASLFTSRPDDLQFSVDQEVFTCEDLGENTVTLSYSNNDVQSSCEVMIIINDVSPPTINIKDINVALNEFGSITITPDMLNNGTSDNCKNLSYSLSKQTFGCKDLGANTVTFTATDASGNSSSTDASVTVTGDCKINPLPGVEYIFIYPNPTSGPFQFATPAGVTIQRVEVFDFRGRMILFKDYSESDLEYIMDLTGVQNAVYILNLFTSEGMEIIRVIIN